MITGIDIRTGIQQSLDGLYGISMFQHIMQNHIPILIFLIDVSTMIQDEGNFFTVFRSRRARDEWYCSFSI